MARISLFDDPEDDSPEYVCAVCGDQAEMRCLRCKTMLCSFHTFGAYCESCALEPDVESPEELPNEY